MGGRPGLPSIAVESVAAAATVAAKVGCQLGGLTGFN